MHLTYKARRFAAAMLITLVAAMGLHGDDEPTHDVDVRDAILQYHIIHESIDYYRQFTWGEASFERYLLMLHYLEPSSLQPGDGIVWMSSGPDRSARIERALLSVAADGSAWWRLAISTEDIDADMEILVAQTGFPLEIRYRHPDTGWIHVREPAMSVGYEDAAQSMGPQALDDAVFDMIADDVARFEQWAFQDLHALDESEVVVEAGSFEATPYEDAIPGGTLEYWFLSDVPGGLISLRAIDEEGNEIITFEAVEITIGNTRAFDDVDLVSDGDIATFGDESEDVAESQGTIVEPLELSPGEWYDGSVAEDGTSYYAVHVVKRSDIQFVVSGHEGRAELFYYADDDRFDDWSSSSTGYEMNVEDYFVQPGSWLYFAVVDSADRGGLGEHYVIEVRQEFILDSIGMLIRGDIYREATEYEAGTYTQVQLDESALEYLSTTMLEDGTLTIEAVGIPDGVGVRWVDATGGYSSASRETNGDTQRIVVSGLSRGSKCYFYIVAEPGITYEPFSLSIAVNE